MTLSKTILKKSTLRYPLGYLMKYSPNNPISVGSLKKLKIHTQMAAGIYFCSAGGSLKK